MIRSALRFAVDCARVAFQDLRAFAGRKLVAFVMKPPEAPHTDAVVNIDQIAGEEALKRRDTLRSVPEVPKKPIPDPPLVGSLEWRRRERAAGRIA